MKNRILLPLLVVVVLAGAVTGVVVEQKHKTAVPTPTPTVSATPFEKAEFQGQDGKTALDLLRAKYTVETKTYSFGDMVVTINGRTADDKHYWDFQVNGVDSQVGAGAYTTKSTDTIDFVYKAM